MRYFVDKWDKYRYIRIVRPAWGAWPKSLPPSGKAGTGREPIPVPAVKNNNGGALVSTWVCSTRSSRPGVSLAPSVSDKAVIANSDYEYAAVA